MPPKKNPKLVKAAKEKAAKAAAASEGGAAAASSKKNDEPTYRTLRCLLARCAEKTGSAQAQGQALSLPLRLFVSSVALQAL
jgi:hypothetical protein